MIKEPIHIKKLPWFYFLLKIIFPGINKNTAITVGHKIYCLNYLRPDIWEHEKIHCRQMRKGVLRHIFKFIFDKKFRLNVELEAYRAQYKFIRKEYGYPTALKMVEDMAGDLSGPMYGSFIGYFEAMDKIKK